MSIAESSPLPQTSPDVNRGLVTPDRTPLYIVEGINPQPKQRMLVLHGALTSSDSMLPLARQIRRHTVYEPHLLHTGVSGLLDVNVGQQLNPIRDAIKRHSDESGQQVLATAYSLNGRRLLQALMEPDGTFDPVTDVEQAATILSPIGDLRDLPRPDEVRTTAFHGPLGLRHLFNDVVINDNYLIEWWRPTNPEIQEHVEIPVWTHFDPLLRPKTQRRIIAHFERSSEAKAV
jgi:hypothetical protein